MKIFLIAPQSQPHQNGSFVREALIRLGHTVEGFDYRMEPALPIGRWKVLGSHWMYPFLVRHLPLVHRQLIQRALDFRPDVILTIKGESITPPTMNYLRRELRVPAVLWFPDDPLLYQALSRHLAPGYDGVLTSSVDAVDWYLAQGVKKARWIGFACEPRVHRKVALSPGEQEAYGADVVFVGVYYPERRRVLERLCGLGLRVWGPYWYRPLLGRRLAKHYMGRGVYFQELVKVYAAAKIVLNIHHPKMRYGGMKANSRVYEACGCGAFQLCDRTRGLEELFVPGEEIGCYEGAEDVLEKVCYYLERPDERERIAQAGQRRAYKDHTFDQRAKEIVAFFEELL